MAASETMTRERARQAGDVLDLMYRAVQAVEARLTLPNRLTSRQFIVMRAISVYGDPPNQAVLVARTGMDRSTLASVLRLLDDRKLVRRVRDKQDRRNLRVTLTDAGKLHMVEAARIIGKAEEHLLDTVTPRHSAAFLLALTAIVRGPL